MELVITLRKKVEDRVEGEALFELVKEKLADKPDIVISGMVNNHFIDSDEH